MRNILLLFILLTNINLFAKSESIMNGYVLNIENNEPVPFANIFIVGTTIGTQADEKGSFSIKLPKDYFKIIVSAVGFETKIIDVKDAENFDEMDIFLKVDIISLSEVSVLGRKDKDWLKKYKDFELSLFGKIGRKSKTEIENKEYIEFKSDTLDGALRAYLDKPLSVKNNKLGYKQTYFLQEFKKDLDKTTFSVIGYFESLKAKDIEEENRWKLNREIAYKGSLRHFFVSMIQNSLEKEGFKAHYKTKDNAQFNLSQKIEFTTELVSYNEQLNLFEINLVNPIVIEYKYNENFIGRSEINPNAKILISTNGVVLNPLSLETSGYFTEYNLTNDLPFDYLEPIKKDFFPLLPKEILPEIISKRIQTPTEQLKISGLKEYYFGGEEIDLRIEVIENTSQLPTTLSVPLYVELIDLSTQRVRNFFTLKIENKFVDFKYELDKDLEGDFQIRVYTKYMLNFSKSQVKKFDFSIYPLNQSTSLKRIEKSGVFMTIHPEGGKLVDGLVSKVVFNSNLKRSLPFQIITNKRDTILNSKTDSLGLFWFDFKPNKEFTYFIEIGNKQLFFPKINPIGITMTIDNISNKSFVRVLIQSNCEIEEKLFLLIMSNGKLVYQRYILIEKRLLHIISKDILPKNCVFYLLNTKGDVLAERNLNISSDSKNTFELFNKEKLSISQPPTFFFDYDLLLQQPIEKNLSISGKVYFKNIKQETNKIVALLSDLDENLDSSYNSKVIYADVKGEDFTFSNLDFFGKKKLTFNSNTNYRIVLNQNGLPVEQKDSSGFVYIKKTESDMYKLEEIRKEIIREVTKRNTTREIELDEIEIKSKRINNNLISGTIPTKTVNRKEILLWGNSKDLLNNLATTNCPQRMRVPLKYFINRREIDENELEYIGFDLNVATIDKISIFKDGEAAAYGNCTCAIVIEMNYDGNSKTSKESQSFTIDGYFRNNSKLP